MTKIDDINSNLGRIADLIEQVISESKVEFEIPPPQCPTCRTINPQILIAESEAKGPFGEYILLATCLHCKKPFYGIPVVWTTVRDKTIAIKLLHEHLERLGLHSNDGNDE